MLILSDIKKLYDYRTKPVEQASRLADVPAGDAATCALRHCHRGRDLSGSYWKTLSLKAVSIFFVTLNLSTTWWCECIAEKAAS